jgi:hypothetical protein
MNRSLLFTLSLCLASSTFAFEGAVDYKMTQGKDQPTNLTYRVKNNRLRVDFDSPNGKDKGAMIYMPAEHAMVILVPSQKMAMRRDTSASEARAKTKKADQIQFTRTGRKETIAGQTCDVYAFKTTDSEGEMCNAEGLGSFYFSNGAQGDTPQWARDAALKGQFPLRVNATEKSGKTFAMVATKIDKSSQPESLFTVPADYKMMGAAPSGPGASRSARSTGAGDAMNPQDMAARMQNASPEERQKMIEQMKKQYGAQ